MIKRVMWKFKMMKYIKEEDEFCCVINEFVILLGVNMLIMEILRGDNFALKFFFVVWEIGFKVHYI